MTIEITSRSLPGICRKLAKTDARFELVLSSYGVPPLWDRPAGFETLLQIILEQQVSLASAKACYDKLTATLERVTPARLLTLDDTEMKLVGFSRQKSAYARYLAEALVNKTLDLNDLNNRPDDEIKSELMRLKGIGEWTSDIYLLMALRRPDVMPRGDVALHTAWHKLSGEPKPSADAFLEIAGAWRPYRSVAARMLWHFYLSERKMVRESKS